MKVIYIKPHGYQYAERICFTYKKKKYLYNLKINKFFVADSVLNYRPTDFFIDKSIIYKEIEVETSLIENFINSKDQVYTEMLINLIKNEGNIS